VVLVQICLPDHADDKDAEVKVTELVNEINSKFGSLSYIPVHYHQREIFEEEYFALLSTANVYLNTVERDSLPSAPLEYAICQEVAGNGALILSEFNGLADYMKGAIVVNPWHTKVH
jgi:trehalose 6-phosphate synthase/phosphatase